MSPAASLLTALLLTLSITATPVEVRAPHMTLPLAKRINTSGGAINLVKHDQTRAAALKERGAATQSSKLDRPSGSITVTNEAVTYVAMVEVGSPATIYNLIVDTGSSNTWVGAGTPYKVTNTSRNTGQLVSVKYGSGYFTGTEWTDTVTLGSGLTITEQSIGVAAVSEGITGVDGILGIGPEDLTQGTLIPAQSTEIPTVTQNLYTQGTIAEEVVGVFFAPTNTKSSTNGELTFGGADTTKYTGTIAYTPLTTADAKRYWGIDESIAYGSTTIMDKIAGIVDTGTTLILLATPAYSAYQAATGATYDSNTGLLELTTSQYNALKNLNFNIGSVAYALTPNGQIWPRALNTYIGGTTGSIYSIINDLGEQSQGGLNFINGQAFLERFYSVFDTTNSRMGFATTSYTEATTN